ncbi:MAG: hypothetical protein KAS32_09905 [Candidatus Peribacteraceae bacterium]|nr:hypothetical protein [Candidatus Peribacteraceae bacterium]
MKVLEQIQALKAFERETRAKEHHEIDRSIDELTERMEILEGCLSSKMDLVIQLLMELPKDQQVQVIQQMVDSVPVEAQAEKIKTILDIEEDDVGFIPEVDTSNMTLSESSSKKQSVSDINLDGALDALDSIDSHKGKKK